MVLMKIEFRDNEPVSYSVRGMYTLTKTFTTDWHGCKPIKWNTQL